MKVYLCGPIHGKADSECKEWRKVASLALVKAGHVALDPMGRDFRGREDANVKWIVQGDLFDIQAADALLVNAEAPGWGTAMEIMYARMQTYRKLIVAFGVPEKPSPWLTYHCDRLAPTLEAALVFFGVAPGAQS